MSSPRGRGDGAIGPTRQARTRSLMGVLVVALLLTLACTGGTTMTEPYGSGGGGSAAAGRSPGPPDATPLATAPAKPESDGTTATIATAKGDIVIELFTKSAPVATQNFINLAEAGYYRNVVFHRIVPDFMIQGGDPTGTGRGGPGYTIRDEPFAGEYVRGTVAMARTPAPNSQGSQFFIVVGDARFLDRTYTIFGQVKSGMEVVDAIVNGPRGGPSQDEALEPVAMAQVTVKRP
jgi:peptidyl-prolyl cis-trans isomerase B (cyclophilin B)